MNAQSSIERAEKAVSEGNHWRAKEILQGRIASHPFEPGICEALGKVLLTMNDQVEAGRYLFISGARAPEYEQAIANYLDRFANSSASQFHSTLPSRIRVVPIEEYPGGVLEELERRGLSSFTVRKEVERRQHPAEVSKLGQWSAAAIGFTILGLVIVGLVNGVAVVIRWLF